MLFVVVVNVTDVVVAAVDVVVAAVVVVVTVVVVVVRLHFVDVFNASVVCALHETCTEAMGELCERMERAVGGSVFCGSPADVSAQLHWMPHIRFMLVQASKFPNAFHVKRK